MTPQRFVSKLAEMALPGVFNPYSDRCEHADLADAPRRRRRNLEGFLQATLDLKVDTIWVARDLGYRGGRRTGIPLTDEVRLDLASKMLGGIALSRATIGPAIAERTAAVVWETLSEIDCPVMLWNIFPLHPHAAGDPFSNRGHTRSERKAARPILHAVLQMLRPKAVVAIGREAFIALEGERALVAPVRHPSYGGQREFKEGIYRLYGVAPARPDLFEPALPAAL